MKAKFELSMSISPKEQETLQKAEEILEKICYTFTEYNQCETCPLHTICQEKSAGISTPHNILYHIINALTVEKE